MNKTFLQLMQEARKEKLTDLEKDQVRNNLLSIIKETPSMEMANNRGTEKGWFTSLSFSSLVLRPIPIGLAFVILTSGITIAANDTLPGDILYPVKVNINEKVGEIFVLSDEAKADRDVKIAERRLHEMEVLIAKNEFNLEISKEVQTNFISHAERAQNRIARLKSVQPEARVVVEVEAKLLEALDMYTKILSVMSESPLETGLPQPTSEINRNNGTGSKLAAQSKLKITQDNVAQIRNLIAESVPGLSPDTLGQVDENLRLLDELVVRGKRDIDSGRPDQAMAVFGDADLGIGKIRLLLNGRIRVAPSNSQTPDESSDTTPTIELNLNIEKNKGFGFISIKI